MADDATPPSAKASLAPEMCFWTPADLRRFLAATAGSEHEALWRTAAMTGMCLGEALGLCWESVDLDTGKLEVRRQVTLVDGRTIKVEHPKTKEGQGPSTSTL